MDMKALEHALAVAHAWAGGFEILLVAGISVQYAAPWFAKKMGWQRFVRGVKIACAIAVVGGLLGNYEVG